MRARSRHAKGRPHPVWAFLNVPFDSEFEPLYLAFIAGVSGFGLIPRSTLEIPTSERRLNRILGLIEACRYSFHDLSRVELDPKRPPTPRFNMPFELGLAVSYAKATHGKHEWTVFEAKKYRLHKSLSDLLGTDPHIHAGTPRGVFRALANVLVRVRQRPTVRELEAIYSDVKRAGDTIKADLRTKSLFGARAFGELVTAAMQSAHKQLRGSGRRRRA